MSDWIHLRGMRFWARHGAHADERELGQTYRVDVSLAHDLASAGASDDLARTIDYGLIFGLVRDVVQGEPRNLVEAVAESVAAKLLAETPARRVRVIVAKPHPPIADADLDEEAVEIERAR